LSGQWFSLGPPVSSTNKSDRHDITEILLKVALNTINQTKKQCNEVKYVMISGVLHMILVVLKVQKVSSIQTCGVWTILVYINWCIKLYNHAQWTTENICIGKYKTWGRGGRMRHGLYLFTHMSISQ